MAKVLVVDDDPTILRLLQVNLEMEGYEVVTASDGSQALQRIRELQPDLVLLDVMMPELDGWQVCEQVRREPDLQHIPVVFLSARAQDADVGRGHEAGADAYITKPFDPLALVELIRDLIAARRT